MRQQSTKLCECGCGEYTLLMHRNNTRYGWVKGEPFRFLKGHGGPRSEWGAHLWKVEDRGYSTPCWIWQRAKDPNGYGRFNNRNQVQSSALAHRESFARAYGVVNEDLDHLCRQPSCINPDHLEPVTHAENLRRGAGTKLTQEQAEQIRALHTPGTPLHDHALAERFGVHPRTVYDVLRGHRWA